MNESRLNVIRRLLEGVKAKVLSVNGDVVTIEDFNGVREVRMPFTNENINDKYLLNLLVYEDNSLLFEIRSYITML